MRIWKYDLHLHSISVHFTNALYPVAILFLVLYQFYRQDSFRYTYFYLMILATLSAPISYLTGVFEWKKKYKGAKVRLFIRKYQWGFILFVVGVFCTLWYGFYPGVLEDAGVLQILFLFLNFSVLPLTVYLGYLGSKLVFGGSH
jgi:uncharacterized membrane protein